MDNLVLYILGSLFAAITALWYYQRQSTGKEICRLIKDKDSLVTENRRLYAMLIRSANYVPKELAVEISTALDNSA